MKRVLSILMSFLMLVMTMGSLAAYGSTATSVKHIKSITAITEVFGDGQKTTAVAVQYDKKIKNSSLTKSTFFVTGRTITKVYANNAALKASNGVDGMYVIIELSATDKNASTAPGMGGGPPPGGNSTSGSGVGGPPSDNGSGDQSGGPHFTASYKVNTAKVTVKQAEFVTTTDGEKYAANSTAIQNDKVSNLVVDDFKQLVYKDAVSGLTVKYNLYVPKNYDKKKSYPMILFIHDASVLSNDTRATLVQGVGAVEWATPEEQAKHECFVLAPEYSVTTANDNFETTKDLDATVDLIKSLEGQYSINKNKIYTTGQSMGCMSSIALNIKYPDLFAASLLVAGQWDATKVATMAKKNIWIIVSAGDDKAYPGMNAITEALQKEGAKVSTSTWSAGASKSEIATDAKKMIAENTNIKYTVLKKGTLTTLLGEEDSSINNHMGTWKVAYSFEPVRDWLFKQVKASK